MPIVIVPTCRACKNFIFNMCRRKVNSCSYEKQIEFFKEGDRININGFEGKIIYKDTDSIFIKKEETMETKFEVGDKVKAFGLNGVVISCNSFGCPRASFEGGYVDSFHENGLFSSWHKEPSLFLVEKAKKSRDKKRYYAWKIKGLTGWYRSGYYDVSGKNTRGINEYRDWSNTEKIIIEDDFVEV